MISFSKNFKSLKIDIIDITLIFQVLILINGCDNSMQRGKDYYFKHGIEYLDKGKYLKALDYFNKSIQLNYNGSEPYFYRGKAFAGLKETSKAISDYSKVLELEPDRADVYFCIGKVYQEGGEFYKAITALGKATKLNHKYSLAYFELALNFEKIQLFVEAIEAYKYALEFAPPDSNEMIEFAVKRILVLKEDKSIFRFDPSSFSNKVMHTIPKKATLKNDQGVKFWNPGRMVPIIPMNPTYDISHQIDPKIPEAYIKLGMTFFDCDEYDDAIKYFTKAIECDSSNCQALMNRGDVFKKTGYLDKAINDFDQVIEFINKSASSIKNSGKNQIPTAIEGMNIHDYIELHPELSIVYYHKAEALEKNLQIEKAIESYKDYINYAPSGSEKRIDYIRDKINNFKKKKL